MTVTKPDEAQAVTNPLFEEKSGPDSRKVVEVSTSYSKKKQFIATLCATMGCFMNGGVIGYTGPAIPTMMEANNTNLYGKSFKVDLQQVSWITSILAIGAFLGALTSGYIMEKVGRKKMLWLVTSGTYFLGYVLIFFAPHVSFLYIGRFLGGMGLGFQLCTATVYIVEIATLDIRGFLGCFVQLQACVGILYTFCLGYFLDWKWLAVANAVWCIVTSLLVLQIPESPRWLLLKGREYSAVRSLEWLRGKDDSRAVERELEIIRKDIAQHKKQRVSITVLLQHWKPFLVALNMMFVLNFSGFNVILYYTINIFMYARTSVDPKVACILVGVTLLVSCILAIMVLAKLNRKIMLTMSVLGMAVCQLIIGYCMYRNEQRTVAIDLSVNSANLTALNFPPNMTRDDIVAHFDRVHEFPAFLGWLPVVAVIGFLFLGNAGYATLVWVVAAELLPPNVRSAANAISICFGFIGGFLVAKTFVDLIVAIQNSGTFYLYSVICFVGFVFVALFVPETKQKTQEEIQRSLNRSFLQCLKDAFRCR